MRVSFNAFIKQRYCNCQAAQFWSIFGNNITQFWKGLVAGKALWWLVGRKKPIYSAFKIPNTILFLNPTLWRLLKVVSEYESGLVRFGNELRPLVPEILLFEYSTSFIWKNNHSVSVGCVAVETLNKVRFQKTISGEEPPPKNDDRRDPAIKGMTSMGSSHLNSTSMLEILSFVFESLKLFCSAFFLAIFVFYWKHFSKKVKKMRSCIDRFTR